MSLKDFQLALAEIITSPQIGQAYHKDPGSLDLKYALSEKEKNRLLSMVSQKGMRTNYMLYQMNRLTPLTMFMGYTLKILHPRLMNVLHSFWAAYPKTSFQFRDEVAFFSAFLKKSIADGKLDLPYLEDVICLEDALNQIRFAQGDISYANDEFFTLHPAARIVYLEHDAHLLVEAMVTYDAAQPPVVPKVPGYYVLYFNGRLKTYPIAAEAAEALIEKRPVEDIPEELVDLGILI
jgi:hypothetical protein